MSLSGLAAWALSALATLAAASLPPCSSPPSDSKQDNALSGASEPAGIEEKRAVARRFVQARLALWQSRLHLCDWRISLLLIPRSQLDRDTRGKIQWDKRRKTAVIWVLDIADYALPFEDALSDLEFTIVHELVHLELASLPKSEATRSNEEHAVNRLASALLELARRSGAGSPLGPR